MTNENNISGLVSVQREVILNICCNIGCRMFSVNIFMLNWLVYGLLLFLVTVMLNWYSLLSKTHKLHMQTMETLNRFCVPKIIDLILVNIC